MRDCCSGGWNSERQPEVSLSNEKFVLVSGVVFENDLTKPIATKSSGPNTGKSCSLHRWQHLGLFLAQLGHALIIWQTSEAIWSQ